MHCILTVDHFKINASLIVMGEWSGHWTELWCTKLHWCNAWPCSSFTLQLCTVFDNICKSIALDQLFWTAHLGLAKAKRLAATKLCFMCGHFFRLSYYSIKGFLVPTRDARPAPPRPAPRKNGLPRPAPPREKQALPPHYNFFTNSLTLLNI